MIWGRHGEGVWSGMVAGVVWGVAGVRIGHCDKTLQPCLYWSRAFLGSKHNGLSGPVQALSQVDQREPLVSQEVSQILGPTFCLLPICDLLEDPKS